MNESLIRALDRLERASGQHARVTEALHEAVARVADTIERLAPHGVVLPRGYIVRDVESNIGSTTLLFRLTGEYDEYDGEPVEQCIDYTGGRYLHGDFNADMSGRGQSRAASLQFSKDVAGGLLDEIAAFLEERTAKAAAATTALDQAAS